MKENDALLKAALSDLEDSVNRVMSLAPSPDDCNDQEEELYAEVANLYNLLSK